MNAGIESLSFYTPHYYLDLKTLAEKRGVDVGKYYVGVGQEKMGMAPPDSDVVTMGANAAHHALRQVDRADIDTIMFATESGIDQSKAAAIYVHALVDLPKNCKAFEIKQACCGSTAGLQMALAFVAQNPKKKVLVVASDVARYDLESPGESTQGAGAVAMVVSADPKIVAFDKETGSYTEDVMDFWRPNYREEACVDGKYSIKVYLNALAESWKQYAEESGRSFDDIEHFTYHLPFTRMAEKAHRHLAKMAGHADLAPEEVAQQLAHTLQYSRATGNSYTASLYVGLASLLDLAAEDLSGQRVGLFSYGSGCMGSYFSGSILPGYRKFLDTERHRKMLESRTELSYDEYLTFYNHHLPTDGSDYHTPRYQTGLCRLAGMSDHKRLYEKVTAHTPAPRAELAGAV